MSKVYVIKNNEGMYVCENARKNYWTDNFEEATIIRENERKDYLVSGKRNFFVECTLVEGDLEKELAKYKKAYYNACGVLCDITGTCAYDYYEKELPDYCDEQCFIETENCLCWDRYLLDRAEKELEEKNK